MIRIHLGLSSSGDRHVEQTNLDVLKRNVSLKENKQNPLNEGTELLALVR